MPLRDLPIKSVVYFPLSMGWLESTSGEVEPTNYYPTPGDCVPLSWAGWRAPLGRWSPLILSVVGLGGDGGMAEAVRRFFLSRFLRTGWDIHPGLCEWGSCSVRASARIWVDRHARHRLGLCRQRGGL